MTQQHPSLAIVPPPPSLDVEQAQRFLAALDPAAERFVFQTFNDSPEKRRELARTLPGTLADLHTTLAGLNQQGAGVFVTINEVAGDRRKAENVTRVRAIFADFDNTAPPDVLPLPPSIRVQSGRGVHLYWLVDRMPLERFQAVQKAIAARLGSDPSVSDLPRVMRLPGSLHRKDTAPVPVRLIECHPERRYTSEEIEAAFPPAAPASEQPPTPPPHDTHLAGSDPYASRAVAHAVAAVQQALPGTRNEMLNREAHGLYGLAKAGRLDQEEVTEALREAAAAAGLRDDEISTTLFSALSAARPRYEGMDRQGGSLPPAADWQPPPPIKRHEWGQARLTPPALVERYLYADLSLLVAAGGTGKTTLALWEAVHIVLERPLYGRTTKGGWVLFLTAEDPREQLVARLRKVCEGMRLTDAELAQVRERVRISDVSGAPFKLAVNDGAGNIITTANVERLTEALADDPPALMVVDPYVSFGPGEASVNDGAQAMVTAARQIMRALGCCVRFIHHTGQEAARSAFKDQYTGRGGTALPDGSRMVAVLTPVEDHSIAPAPLRPLLADGGQLLELSLPKLSYCPPQQPILIARQGWRIEWAEKPSTSEITAERDREDEAAMLRFIRSALKRGEKHTRRSIEEQHERIGLPRNRVRAAVSHLTEQGHLEIRNLPREERRGQRKDYLHPVQPVMSFL